MKRVAVIKPEHGPHMPFATIDFSGVIIEKATGLEVPMTKHGVEPQGVRVIPTDAIDSATIRSIWGQLAGGAISGKIGEYEWQSE
jgi:hypothetical protein